MLFKSGMTNGIYYTTTYPKEKLIMKKFLSTVFMALFLVTGFSGSAQAEVSDLDILDSANNYYESVFEESKPLEFLRAEGWGEKLVDEAVYKFRYSFKSVSHFYEIYWGAKSKLHIIAKKAGLKAIEKAAKDAIAYEKDLMKEEVKVLKDAFDDEFFSLKVKLDADISAHPEAKKEFAKNFKLDVVLLERALVKHIEFVKAPYLEKIAKFKLVLKSANEVIFKTIVPYLF